MTTTDIREPGARALSLMELKAAAYDAIKQSEMWRVKASELNQRVAEMEAQANGGNDSA